MVDIEKANYIIVDRNSAGRIPPLKELQWAIDAIWVDHSLEIEDAQDTQQYVIVPEQASQSITTDVDEKPLVTSDGAIFTVDAKVPGNLAQTQSLTAGRKRAAALSTPQPVAKMKRVGTPKATQVSHTSTNEASASVANQATYSLSGLYQIASAKETPSQKASRKHYVAQVVDELDEWCEGGYNGTRTVFLVGKRKEANVSLKGYHVLMIQPEFDRAAFFSYNKRAILSGLSQRGRETGMSSALFEGTRQGGKLVAVEPSSATTSRPVQFGSSEFQHLPQSPTPESSHQSIPSPIHVAPATGDLASLRKQSVTASATKQVKCSSSAELPASALASTETAVKHSSNRLENKGETQLDVIIDELSQWCLDGSEGSRSAYLAERRAADVSSIYKSDSSTHLRFPAWVQSHFILWAK